MSGQPRLNCMPAAPPETEESVGWPVEQFPSRPVRVKALEWSEGPVRPDRETVAPGQTVYLGKGPAVLQGIGQGETGFFPLAPDNDIDGRALVQ